MEDMRTGDATATEPDADINQLRTITLDILDPARPIAELIPHILELRTLLERRSKFDFNPEQGIRAEATLLDSGLAISPLQAALCAREVLRSAAFIKGVGYALHDLIHAFKNTGAMGAPGRPVRVLYAGCGPFALLALPLMACFSPQQVTFGLIDIHPKSLQYAQDLIAGFGLTSSVYMYECADATRYQIPADQLPDLIVSETMNVALGREPQVTIARQLMTQAPEAMMIPAQVRVEACLLDEAKEFHARVNGDTGSPDRIYLGRVFDLDKTSIQTWKTLTSDCLPAARIKLPVSIEKRYQLRLLTRIIVYGDASLLDYESSLNLPQRLPGKPHFLGGEVLQFHYRLGKHPGLAFEIAA